MYAKKAVCALRSIVKEQKTILRKTSRLRGVSFNIPEETLESCDGEDGMRLICDYKNSPITIVGCFLPAGAIYETPYERGSALFLEHLLFKRTTGRGYESDIGNKIAEIGGRLRATATRDIFLFYGTVPSCNTELLIEIFSHVILNGVICTFAEEDVASQKCVILHHLSNMETDYEQVAMDYLQDISYQDTQLGRSIYPKTDVIKNISAQNVTCFRERLFKPCFMTMVSSGGICLSDLFGLVCTHFGSSSNRLELLPEPCKPKIVECTNFRFSGGDLRLRDDDEELGFVALGIEGPGCLNHQDHCTLTVAKEIVGSWDMSYGGANHNAPFLAHCAFNTDLCYVYKSFSLDWPTTSIWGCYFVCDKMKLDDMTFMLQKEWLRLCTTITQKEVERAVNQCITNELMKFHDPLERFHDIVTCLFHGGYYESYEDRLCRYRNVSVHTVKEAADEYIYDQCPALVGLGRIENLTDYINVRSRMKSLLY